MPTLMISNPPRRRRRRASSRRSSPRRAASIVRVAARRTSRRARRYAGRAASALSAGGVRGVALNAAGGVLGFAAAELLVSRLLAGRVQNPHLQTAAKAAVALLIGTLGRRVLGRLAPAASVGAATAAGRDLWQRYAPGGLSGAMGEPGGVQYAYLSGDDPYALSGDVNADDGTVGEAIFTSAA